METGVPMEEEGRVLASPEVDVGKALPEPKKQSDAVSTSDDVLMEGVKITSVEGVASAKPKEIGNSLPLPGPNDFNLQIKPVMSGGPQGSLNVVGKKERIGASSLRPRISFASILRGATPKEAPKASVAESTSEGSGGKLKDERTRLEQELKEVNRQLKKESHGLKRTSSQAEDAG
ncbi:hypothetical protein L7F22_014076 [Adiantum nelumboides]|nr:hypothetical protein [Adiantum nelumboides]